MFASRLLPLACLGLVGLFGSGCSFGPRVLESTHGRYNESVKNVTEEQLLLNLVRLRYNDDAVRLDVSSIAAQFSLDASLEARPFSSSQAARFENPSVYGVFNTILPFASVAAADRPTITMTPLDNPETIRSLFQRNTLDGIVFMAESGWPVSTIFRLWLEELNRLPNAVSASGPPRQLPSPFRDFQRVVRLLQLLQDRGDVRFVRDDKFVDLGAPLPPESVTAAALMEADKNGYQFRQLPNRSWILAKRQRRLEMKLNPASLATPEVLELCQLLDLKAGLSAYEVSVSTSDLFPRGPSPGGSVTLDLVPRSTVQALFYMSHGVIVPPEHLQCGIVKPTLEPDGTVFDWQEVTAGLFTVQSCKQHCRPKNAWLAVCYRDHWFYIDDSDNDSKITFTLMMVLARSNLLGVRKDGPTLTLPVGR